MKVSIVTPTYNAALFVAQTLDSVRAQSMTDWEHVIVDDGSSDNTLVILQDHAENDPRIRIYQKDHGGVANARNFGYAMTSPDSEFVIFLDHDDCWTSHTLECLLQILTDQPHAVAAHGLVRITTLDSKLVEDTTALEISHNRRLLVQDADAGHRIDFCDQQQATVFASMICNCGVPTPGIILLRKAAFELIREDYGYFDPAVGSGNDWDAWIRLTLHGPMAFVNEILLDWRQHQNNGTNDQAETRDADQKVRAKMMQLPVLNTEQRAMAEWRYNSLYPQVPDIGIISGGKAPVP